MSTGAQPGAAGELPADSLPASVPLACGFDTGRMAAEVARLRPATWQVPRTFGTARLAASGPAKAPPRGRARAAAASTVAAGAAEPSWRMLALRSIGGEADGIDPGGPGLLPYEDTVWLRRCPYLGEVLEQVPAPLRSARLSSLDPGTPVPQHSDGKYGLPYGVLRLHVPVVTNPRATVVIDGFARHWDAGRLWYGDFSRSHYTRNDGAHRRVHLVIDCLVTPALLAMFPTAFRRRLAAGGVLLGGEPFPIEPMAMMGYRCRFMMPAGFADWADGALESPWDEEVPASITPAGGRFVLSVGGRPRFGLVHLGVGEFRFDGWSQERTVQVDPDGPPPRVTFRVRRGNLTRETSRPLL
jgi:hypothetical protein